METLTRVLKYGTNDFFNFIRNIDYGYIDVKGKIHRISPNDDCSKQGGEPYVFSSPDQVVANICIQNYINFGGRTTKNKGE